MQSDHACRCSAVVARMASPLLHVDRHRSTGHFPGRPATGSRKCCHPANRILRKLKQEAGDLPYSATRGRFVDACVQNGPVLSRSTGNFPVDLMIPCNLLCLTMNVTKIEALRRRFNRTVSDILRDRSTADADIY